MMKWRSVPVDPKGSLPSRRQLLIGSAAAGGLIVGWSVWPRRYLPNVSAARGESVFNGYLKIGSDGHIVIVVPQIELGQASTTVLPQIVADELGADWRTIGVEPATPNQFYNNVQFVDWAGWHGFYGLINQSPLQVTEESLLLAGFADPMRQAAAEARERLCLAAAARWGVDRATCDTVSGFVVSGKQRLRFGDLAVDAAHLRALDSPPLREGLANRLMGQSVPRLDAPAKVDGSVNYAADIRLPDMVFATIRQGPLGDTALHHYDQGAARKIVGAVDVIALADGLACIGSTSWVASKMMDAAAPIFITHGKLVEGADVAKALDAALKAGGTRIMSQGDADAMLSVGTSVMANYQIGLLPHLALEPMAATARYKKGVLEIWTSAQMPASAQAVAAKASGLSQSSVIIHSVMGGSSFGRRYELESVAQVAQLAVKLGRPVQLFWTRGEDMMHDRFGAAMAAKMSAQVMPDGRITAWAAALAAPATMTELKARTLGWHAADVAMHNAEGELDSALTAHAKLSYALPNFAVDVHPAMIGVPTGPMRGGAALATCFANESFINELAARTGIEPFSFRMALLTGNMRLAHCLAKASALSGWQGGASGTNQGIACFATNQACVAVVAEAKIGEDAQIQVVKLTAVADIGQLVNPDIARQQIEGGLLFGLSLALSAPLQIKRGIAGPVRMGEHHLPRLADTPEIIVELMPSNLPPADAWDIAVPPTAPAIAGALFAASGKHFRSLPFALMGAA